MDDLQPAFKCEPGTFNGNVGASSCEKCPVGRFMPGEGAALCSAANMGHYVPLEGATEQIICPPGSHQPNWAQHMCLKQAWYWLTNIYREASGLVIDSAE